MRCCDRCQTYEFNIIDQGAHLSHRCFAGIMAEQDSASEADDSEWIGTLDADQDAAQAAADAAMREAAADAMVARREGIARDVSESYANRAYDEESRPKPRGGKRAGAGRKPLAESIRRQQICVQVLPATAAWLRARASATYPLGRVVDGLVEKVVTEGKGND
jgi:hypothetical protein